jgi:hypothetical protein
MWTSGELPKSKNTGYSTASMLQITLKQIQETGNQSVIQTLDFFLGLFKTSMTDPNPMWIFEVFKEIEVLEKILLKDRIFFLSYIIRLTECLQNHDRLTIARIGERLAQTPDPFLEQIGFLVQELAVRISSPLVLTRNQQHLLFRLKQDREDSIVINSLVEHIKGNQIEAFQSAIEKMRENDQFHLFERSKYTRSLIRAIIESKNPREMLHCFDGIDLFSPIPPEELPRYHSKLMDRLAYQAFYEGIAAPNPMTVLGDFEDLEASLFSHIKDPFFNVTLLSFLIDLIHGYTTKDKSLISDICTNSHLWSRNSDYDITPQIGKITETTRSLKRALRLNETEQASFNQLKELRDQYELETYLPLFTRAVQTNDAKSQERYVETLRTIGRISLLERPEFIETIVRTALKDENDPRARLESFFTNTNLLAKMRGLYRLSYQQKLRNPT